MRDGTLVVLCALWALAAPAGAQPKVDEDARMCAELEVAGYERAQAGQYVDARTFYLKAFGTCADPVNLVRVARTYQDEGDDAKALEFVIAFLRDASIDHPLRPQLQQAKKELSERVLGAGKEAVQTTTTTNRARRHTTLAETELAELERRRAFEQGSTTTRLSAASDDLDFGDEKDWPDRAIFAEAGGPGLLYSLNYEQHLGRDFVGRVGLSYLRLSADSQKVNVATAPLTVSYVGIASGRHALEIGVGGTGVYASVSGDEVADASFGLDAGFDGFAVWGTALVGYRFQSFGGGFQGRVGALMLVGDGLSWGDGGDGGVGVVPWGYLSVGAGF